MRFGAIYHDFITSLRGLLYRSHEYRDGDRCAETGEVLLNHGGSEIFCFGGGAWMAGTRSMDKNDSAGKRRRIGFMLLSFFSFNDLLGSE